MCMKEDNPREIKGDNPSQKNIKGDNPSQKNIKGDNSSQKNIKGDNSRKIIICMEQQVIFYMAYSSDIILNVLCIF